MKYLFLTVLMIGVGIGIVGCEDDDDDSSSEETEEVVVAPRYPDISGRWYNVYVGRDGRHYVIIRQSGLQIMVSDESTDDSTQAFSSNGSVTEAREVRWCHNGDCYSGSIHPLLTRMDGTVSNQTTGAINQWAAGKHELEDNADWN